MRTFVGEKCMVRSNSAGVFAGTIVEREGKEVLLRDARRIYYWSGAATLSQLSVEGTKNPSGCKFPCPVQEVLLTEVIEIIPMSERAIESIDGVPEWRK